MSVIIKDRGIYKMYIKGADSKIKERLNQTHLQPFKEFAEE